MNYNLGDTMINEMCKFVGGGFPWKLQALWIAYCNATSEGIRKLRGFVRCGDGQLQQLVVSGTHRLLPTLKNLSTYCGGPQHHSLSMEPATGPKNEPVPAMLEWSNLEKECHVCHVLLLTLPNLTHHSEMVSHAMANATRAAMRGKSLPFNWRCTVADYSIRSDQLTDSLAFTQVVMVQKEESTRTQGSWERFLHVSRSTWVPKLTI